MESRIRLKIRECRKGKDIVGYALKRRYPFLKIFYQWKTMSFHNSYHDAIMAKIMYIPKSSEVYDEHSFCKDSWRYFVKKHMRNNYKTYKSRIDESIDRMICY